MQVENNGLSGSVVSSKEKGLAGRATQLAEDIFRNANRQITPGATATFSDFTLTVVGLERGVNPPPGSMGTLLAEAGSWIRDPKTYNDSLLNPVLASARPIIDSLSTKAHIELRDSSGKTCSFTIPIVAVGVGFKESPNHSKALNFSLEATPHPDSTLDELGLFRAYSESSSDFRVEREGLNIPPLVMPPPAPPPSTTTTPTTTTGTGKVAVTLSSPSDFTSPHAGLISQIVSLVPSEHHRFIPKNQTELVSACEEIATSLSSYVDDEFISRATVEVKKESGEVISLSIHDVCAPSGEDLVSGLAASPETVQGIYKDILAELNSRQGQPLTPAEINGIVHASIIKNAGVFVFPGVTLKAPSSKEKITLIAVPSPDLAPGRFVPINGTDVCLYAPSAEELERPLGLTPGKYTISLNKNPLPA